MAYIKKLSVIFLMLASTSITVMDRPITEAERLRSIVNDDARWSALSEKQQGQLLADLYIAEAEEEKQEALRRKQIESEKKSKEITEAKKREEEELALKKARAELDRGIEKERERKRLESASSENEGYLKQLFEKSLFAYKDEMPFMVEYLSTKTLRNLLRYTDKFNDTSVVAPLAGQYQLGTNAMTEFIVKLSAALHDELKKRETSGKNDFKSLIIKGLAKAPYLVDFETFQGLQNKLKALDLLQNDQKEKELWALESNVNTGQITQALYNIKEPLIRMSISVKEQVLKDLDAAEAERRAEQQARDSVIQILKEAAKEKQYQLKIENVKKTYPQFFKGIPYNLEADFLKKFEELYSGPGKDINQVLTNLYLDPRSNSLINRLLTLGNVLNFNSYAAGGYVFFDNNGQRSVSSGVILPRVLSITDRDPLLLNKRVAEATKELVKTYKIHLMPDENMDATEILVRLNKALRTDPELSSTIQTFKILYNPTKQGNVNFARVVIYANGKEQAQKILDALYKNNVIKDIKGSAIRPRFNGRVNDLIWVAQGDGDYKDGIYTGYYEPSLIYYNPGITGKRENYHLVNPETKQEILT